MTSPGNGPGCCPPRYNVFDDREARGKLDAYRKDGPDAQSRELVGILERQGIEGATAVDIGAGIGAIGHALVAAGVGRLTDIDGSPAFLAAAREEAEAAVRAREVLLSMVSHDLRSPLSTIKLSVKMMQKQAASPGGPQAEQVVTGLGRIDGSADKMNMLIDDLLDFARLQMGQPLDLAYTPTDLVILARKVALDHRHNSNRHRIRVSASVPSLPGLWDPARIERVLDNLLSNAVKYSPGGSEIKIEVAKEEGDPPWAVVVVRDQGMGIPADDLPYIFEWFRRASNVSGRVRGTGVGLAGARQVVEQHGGTITAESQEGEGSTFTVRLPLDSS